MGGGGQVGKETLERSGQTGWGPARGGEWGSPASRAPSQAPWGAWRAPLGPAVHQSCSAHLSAVARPAPRHPLPFFRRSAADTSGGGKGGAEAGSERRQGCSSPGGEPGSHWPPLDTSGQGHLESFLIITKSSFFSLEQESTKSMVPGVCPGAELRDSSRPASALFCPLSTLQRQQDFKANSTPGTQLVLGQSLRTHLMIFLKK